MTSKEHHTLHRTSRRATAPHREVLRANIVLLAHRGWGTAKIARKLGCCENTVRHWRDSFADYGLDGLNDLPRPGGVPVYGAEVHLTVISLACEPPSARGLPLSRYSVSD
ncbi:MAG: helix-turn-helix domain-containing protein, partial [Thermoplasmata archaeon]